ncbi:MAG: hypothetical protein QOJ06_1858 [Pseudonocardiales bacterium]|jgi:hypothetical protein|nr:hypothetical protein [Pseudonocardiales bacterium]
MGTDFNYDDTSHQIIFDHINGGAGSDALQEISQSWQRLGDGVGTTCKSYVQNAIAVMLSSRQGAAADSAAAATGAMLPWMDIVVQATATVAQRAQDQAEHWVNAKNSVPPVPPTPKSAGFSSDPGEWAAEKMDWFPGITSDEEKAQQRQQDAAEQARQAMRVYQSNSNGNIDVAPAFTPPQGLDGSIGALPLTSPRPDAAGSAPLAIAIAGGGTPSHLRAAHQPAAPPAAHQGAAYQPVPTFSQLAQTAPTATANTLTPPNQGGATAAQVMPPGGLPIGAGLAEGSTGSARSVPARGSAAGMRLGAAGEGGRTGFGPRPTTGFGPRPTTSAHPALDEMSATRGTAGSAVRNTGEAGYGQPFGGTANQPGEHDREHRSKYLIHEDSNAIVGDLPPTAPPVIGADY